MEQVLRGVRIAVVVADGFEQVEMVEPKQALEIAGATTYLLSPVKGAKVRGWQHDHWGDEFAIDGDLIDCDLEEFDALLLPGGVMNPDTLRMDPQAVAFVRGFVDAGKPIAAICHGPWMLVETGAVRGRTVTSWPSLRTDITNAGGEWVDREVVVDGNLVTSRNPSDISAFNREAIALFARARPQDGRSVDVDTLAVDEEGLTGADEPAMAGR